LTSLQVCEEGIRFFDLPEQDKLAIEMKNAPSFLGYSRLGNEITAQAPDWREQLDLSTPHDLPSDQDPLYHNLLAPNQWPNDKLLPDFRPIFEDYMQKMGEVSITFTSLIAESLGLDSNAFNNFFDKDQQHKLKIVKYPVWTTWTCDSARPYADDLAGQRLRSWARSWPTQRLNAHLLSAPSQLSPRTPSTKYPRRVD
jgi:isopenicillin N synthase-like dioxygenase